MIAELLQQLQRCLENPNDLQQLPVYAGRIHSLDSEETEQLFEALIDLAKSGDPSVWPNLYLALLGHTHVDAQSDWPSPESLSQINELYKICPADSPLRNHLLAMMAKLNTEDAVNLWTELICKNPPNNSDGISFAFRPLLAAELGLPPRILKQLVDEGTGNIHVAAAIYDLANHAVRSGKVVEHPASHRRDQLCELLGALVQKLAQIEEGKLPDGESPETIAATIANAVSLIVALTDALALLKEERASSNLQLAANLKHRRIQVEAAAALASLGDEWGKQKLIECAAEPSIRQRAVAYAKELGLDKQISLEYTGPIAIAESFLAMWLSLPEQMGLAPTEMKLLDQRKLYWPGYEDQIDCFLFEYRYGLGEGAHNNIGISGPATHAFTADLTELSAEDQYAAFAGWQTLSDEIYLIPIERAESVLAPKTAQLKKRLQEQQADSVKPEALISFFGSYALVTSVVQNAKPGTLIVEDESSQFIGAANEMAPIDWRTALDIWKGRKLLASFNPAFSS